MLDRGFLAVIIVIVMVVLIYNARPSLKACSFRVKLRRTRWRASKVEDVMKKVVKKIALTALVAGFMSVNGLKSADDGDFRFVLPLEAIPESAELFDACIAGHYNAVELLIDNGADKYAVDSIFEHIVVKEVYGHAPVNVAGEGDSHECKLQGTQERQADSFDIARLLFEEGGVDVNVLPASLRARFVQDLDRRTQEMERNRHAVAAVFALARRHPVTSAALVPGAPLYRLPVELLCETCDIEAGVLRAVIQDYRRRMARDLRDAVAQGRFIDAVRLLKVGASRHRLSVEQNQILDEMVGRVAVLALARRHPVTGAPLYPAAPLGRLSSELIYHLLGVLPE